VARPKFARFWAGVITFRRRILVFDQVREFTLSEITEVRSERTNVGRTGPIWMIQLVTALGQKVTLFPQDQTNVLPIIRDFLGLPAR
jgi:hypothetical protein